MTREEAKQLLPIIKAFSEGKVIQIKQGDEDNPNWVDATCSLLNFDNPVECYRIKPSPTYRPFANAEECWDEMQKHKPFGWVIDKRDGTKIAIESIDSYACDIEKYSRNYDIALEVYTFADGAAFGVKIEEG